jgi:hypothetical protein
MLTTEERLSPEDLLYLKVAIALAFGNPDLKEMPKTLAALEVLYEKIERMYHQEANKAE